jgi:hypothetical protein
MLIKRKIITNVIILVSSLMLGGCVTIVGLDSKELEPFTPIPEKYRLMNKVVMEWKIVDNLKEACNAKSGSYIIKNDSLLGCAVWFADKKECTIITTKKVSHMILGHEVRHCFEGHFHK